MNKQCHMLTCRYNINSKCISEKDYQKCTDVVKRVLFQKSAEKTDIVDKLIEERDFWEREAKKWCSQLSELRYKIRQQICDKCQDEDTDKCKECNK